MDARLCGQSPELGHELVGCFQAQMPWWGKSQSRLRKTSSDGIGESRMIGSGTAIGGK